MSRTRNRVSDSSIERIRTAAEDQTRIRGLTHTYYRYPARFSPLFARTCIEELSKPGDVVCDPFMGGATAIVEGMLGNRVMVGSDINALSVFIARVKTTLLSGNEKKAIAYWASDVVPRLRCHEESPHREEGYELKPRNMTLPSTRWLRKTISLCLISAMETLPSQPSKDFARCVLLNVGQWALNARRNIPTASEFRCRVGSCAIEMLAGIEELATAADGNTHSPVLCQCDAEAIDAESQVRAMGLVDLVVTSPPYPGVHMLYHRWQVDGRKETDAPYWISACEDGAGAAYYNFAPRRGNGVQKYFEKTERSFAAIRRIMRNGGILAQMVAFSDSRGHFDEYLKAISRAGFDEMRSNGHTRIWRDVPNRRWHASLKGRLPSSKEVVLLHRAI